MAFNKGGFHFGDISREKGQFRQCLGVVHPGNCARGFPCAFPFFGLGPPGAAGFPSFEEGDFLFDIGVDRSEAMLPNLN
jgi:hypothetical protein